MARFSPTTSMRSPSPDMSPAYSRKATTPIYSNCESPRDRARKLTNQSPVNIKVLPSKTNTLMVRKYSNNLLLKPMSHDEFEEEIEMFKNKI